VNRPEDLIRKVEEREKEEEEEEEKESNIFCYLNVQ
jgi:hypothetical protein